MVGAIRLDAVTREAERLEGVRRADPRFGDWIVVDTRNSSYWMLCLGDGRYCVLGGWFDLRGLSPATITVRGCTWGGSAIHTELIAAPCLFLEFGNGVVTTRIQRVRLIRAGEPLQLN